MVSPLPVAVGGLVAAACSGDLGVSTVAVGAGEAWWEFFRIPELVCQTCAIQGTGGRGGQEGGQVLQGVLILTLGLL